jgi:outer membrane protein assembly factor BamA
MRIILFTFLLVNTFCLVAQEIKKPATYLVQLDNDASIKIDTIIVIGNKTTDEKIIFKELSFSANDSINLSIIEYNELRVYSTELFTRVKFFIFQDENEKNTLQIHVNERWYLFPYPIFGFRERNWDNIFYGLGVAHINFLGLNQKVFGSLILGYDPNLRFHYINPNFIRKDYKLDMMAMYSKTKNKSYGPSGIIDDFDEYWYNARVSLGHRIDIYRHVGLSLGYNRIELSEMIPEKTLSKNGKDEFFYLTVSGEINTRDLNEFPMQGELLSVYLRNYGLGFSEIDFWQAGVDIRKYILIADGHSLCFRGFTDISIGSRIPYYSNFYFGYRERLRGSFKDIKEGANILGLFAEYRLILFGPKHLVIKDMPMPQLSVLRYGLAASFFIDAGEVWNNKNFRWNKFDTGFGFGLNFLLPYSIVIRTELGVNSSSLKSRFIFDVGASF